MTPVFADSFYCISFAAMAQLGMRDALTGDHHFEQAGFRILFPQIAKPDL